MDYDDRDIDEIISLTVALAKSNQVVESYMYKMKEANDALKVANRNCLILTELVHEMNDAVKELAKITGHYHPKIISGDYDEEDIDACSKICKRAMKYLANAENLRKSYDEIRSDKHSLTETINIVKGE